MQDMHGRARIARPYFLTIVHMDREANNMARTFSMAALVASITLAGSASALDNDSLSMTPRNGWSAFEVISVGDDVPGDGIAWALPGTFDGIGAQRVNGALRIQLNHETSNATISEINLNRAAVLNAINATINSGNTNGVSFVTSAGQAYNQISYDGGANFTGVVDPASTAFARFCSGQSFVPNTFGAGRGFVDDIYITGEEGGAGRLMALDINNRSLYQLSGNAGDNGAGGTAGIGFDPWENAALLDTGESNHIAMLMSPDKSGGILQLYIGEKGKDATGAISNDFLARNGLAYGSYYFLDSTLPANEGDTTAGGGFASSSAGVQGYSKMEDIDTSPSNPTMVVLGNQDNGTFIYDFTLDFTGGTFNAGTSSFDLTKIADDVTDDLDLHNADNVDWTAATTLNGTTYADGLLFVNEDDNKGQVWMMLPDGTSRVLIADTDNEPTFFGTESSGILDISGLVGYNPGSILLVDHQGADSSLSVLINPDATPVPEPTSLALLGLGGLLVARRRRRA